VVINLIDNNIYSRLIFMCGPAVDEKYKMTCESVQDVMSLSNIYNYYGKPCFTFSLFWSCLHTQYTIKSTLNAST